MPLAKMQLSSDRIEFYGSLSKNEIDSLIHNKKVSVLQTSQPIPLKTYIALDQQFFSVRPDVQLRVYGFYSGTCDLGFLKKMPHVHRFEVDCHGPATNVGAVTQMQSLQELGVAIFELDDFGFLTDIPTDLRVLFLGRTRSKKPDLAPIERLKVLKRIYIEGQRKNIEAMSALIKLEDVTLRSITVKDLSFLRPLSKMWSLDMKLGGSNNLEALSDIESIKYLELWQIRGMSDLGVVSRLPNLQYLFLQSLRQVEGIPDLSKLSSLKRIHLENMQGLCDVSSLATAPALEEFIHVAAQNTSPEDYLPVLKNKSVRKVLVGFGSERKNNYFDALIKKFGKQTYKFQEFQFV